MEAVRVVEATRWGGGGNDISGGGGGIEIPVASMKIQYTHTCTCV